MASQGANNIDFDFNAGASIDFTGFGMQPAFNDLKGTGEGNTSSAFFFGDEGIDTTATTFDHSFDSMFVGDMSSTTFGMEPLVCSISYRVLPFHVPSSASWRSRGDT